MNTVGEKRAARRARGFSVVVGRMGAATTLALRRFTLRWLRKLVDVADDRLHAAEVTLRNDLSVRNEALKPAATRIRDAEQSQDMPHRVSGRAESENFQQWEARRSGIAPISKKAARQRRERTRMTAAAFDLKYAR
jgi:hypothetical protein